MKCNMWTRLMVKLLIVAYAKGNLRSGWISTLLPNWASSTRTLGMVLLQWLREASKGLCKCRVCCMFETSIFITCHTRLRYEVLGTSVCQVQMQGPMLHPMILNCNMMMILRFCMMSKIFTDSIQGYSSMSLVARTTLTNSGLKLIW